MSLNMYQNNLKIFTIIFVYLIFVHIFTLSIMTNKPFNLLS